MQESDVALRLCGYIRRGLLDSDHEVVCTRASDKFVSLVGRCEIANVAFADLLLSIHCNAFSNPNAHGAEFWTSRGTTNADAIAERLFDSIEAAFPRLAMRADHTDGDSDREAGFVVLTQSRMPAVLVEVAFISNPLEERWLRDVGWLMRFAGSIVSGLRRP